MKIKPNAYELSCLFLGLDRPGGLTAVNVTDTSALLLWQPSVATVDGYVITYIADTGVSTISQYLTAVVIYFYSATFLVAPNIFFV